MLYAIRRLDTRQLFMGFVYTLDRIVASWSITPEQFAESPSNTLEVAIYQDANEDTLADIKGKCGIDAVYVPVSIGG